MKASRIRPMPPLLTASSLPELFPLAHTRSPGRHLSHIIHDFCIINGLYEAREQTDPTRLHLGQAAEHAIAEGLRRQNPDRYVAGYEIECDSIFMTFDLMDCLYPAIHEMKLTWMSSSHAIDSQKLWKYWSQLKGYCYGTGIAYGVLHIVYVMGDYRGSGPQYRRWEQEFTQYELESNWRLLIAHERTMTVEGR